MLIPWRLPAQTAKWRRDERGAWQRFFRSDGESCNSSAFDGPGRCCESGTRRWHSIQRRRRALSRDPCDETETQWLRFISGSRVSEVCDGACAIPQYSDLRLSTVTQLLGTPCQSKVESTRRGVAGAGGVCSDQCGAGNGTSVHGSRCVIRTKNEPRNG